MSILLPLTLTVLVFLLVYVLYRMFGKDWKWNCGVTASPGAPPPIQNTTCTFLENDILTDNVHDKYGAKISKNMQIECSQCKEYVYKGPDGCAPYEKDAFLDMKDRGKGINLNLCTALAFPRKCEEIFKTKTPPQTE